MVFGYGVVVSVGCGVIIIRGFISAYIGEIFRALGSSGIYWFGTGVNFGVSYLMASIWVINY